MNKRLNALYTGTILIIMVFMSCASAIRASLLTELIGYYHLESYLQGLPATFANLGSMAALISALVLVRYIRKPMLLLLATVFLTATTALIATAPTFGLYLSINLLCGFGIGLMDTLTSSSMADVQQGKNAGFFMNLLHACFGIGGILSPLLYSGLLGNGMRWNLVYLVLAGIGVLFLIYALPVSLKQNRLPVYGDMMRAGRIGRKEVIAIAKDKGFMIFVLMMFFFGLFWGGVNSWIVRFVSDTYNAPKAGDLAFSLIFIGTTAGRLTIPLFGIPSRTYVKISGFFSFALFSLALLTHSATATVILATIAAYICAPTIPFIASLACGHMRENTAIASTLIFLAMYIGQAISSPVIGTLTASVSPEVGMLFCYCFAMLTSLAAIPGLAEAKTKEA